MADRKSGHLIENNIGFRFDRVFLVDMLDRGFPPLTHQQMIEAAGSKRMATSLIRRGLVGEASDGSLRVSTSAKRFAQMWKARETKKDRRRMGLVDIVVAFAEAGGKDTVRFHGRTEFGRTLIGMHPATGGDMAVERGAAAPIVLHMRNDGAIIEDRTRVGYRGLSPSVLANADA